MSRFNVPKASILPALILALIVGFTFKTLKNYGPESTIRSLHDITRKIYLDSVQNRPVSKADWQNLEAHFMEDIGQPTFPSGDVRARELVRYLYGTTLNGASYSLAKMDRYPDEVRIAVLYKFPDKRVIPLIWVVIRDPITRQWKISAAKSVLA